MRLTMVWPETMWLYRPLHWKKVKWIYSSTTDYPSDTKRSNNRKQRQSITG